jgi:WD40-like Beta Propeller Repeat
MQPVKSVEAIVGRRSRAPGDVLDATTSQAPDCVTSTKISSTCGSKRCALWLIATALAAISCSVNAVAQNTRAPSASALQTSLPRLRLARSLSVPNEVGTLGIFQSGNSNLTLSPDGQRLAAYVRNGLGIIILSPDGKYHREFPRYTDYGLNSHVLGFLSGHRFLVCSAAADSNDSQGWKNVESVAFSVLDPETGKVLHNIPGPNPGRPFNENSAADMAISPDERFIAVIYPHFTRHRVAVFSTEDWRQVAAPDSQTGEKGDDLDPLALAFSPDSKTLAVVQGFNGRVKLYEVGSWNFVRSILTFPETPPPMDVLLLDAIAFSPDGSMIAVASHGGGSWWMDGDRRAREGSGVLKKFFPADPLRVYRVSDGTLVASLESFPGGLASSAQLAWSRKGDYLTFLDGVGDIRLWNPLQPGLSVLAAHMGRNSRTVLLTKDGSQLLSDFPDGVKIFDIVRSKSGATP